MRLIEKWQKCASVTYGGQPYFFNRGNYTIIWNRPEKVWNLVGRYTNEIIEEYPTFGIAMKDFEVKLINGEVTL